MNCMPHLKTNTNLASGSQNRHKRPSGSNAMQCNVKSFSASKSTSRATKKLTLAFFLPLPNIVDMIASWLDQALGFALPIPAGCIGRSGEKMRRLRDAFAFGKPSRRVLKACRLACRASAGTGSSKNMTHHVSLESSTNAKEATATRSRQKIRRFFSLDQWRSGRHRRPPRTGRGRGRRRGAEIMVGRPPAREPPPARPAVGGAKRI